MTVHQFVLEDRYRHPLFFTSEHIVLDDEMDPRSRLFGPDLYAAYLSHEHPSEKMSDWLNYYMARWKEIKEQLYPMYDERNVAGVEEGMREGLSIFFMLLYWSNERSVNLADWKEEVDGLSVTVINAKERIDFIVSRPAVYFSYIQLGELMTELHKSIAKHEMMKKRKNKR